MRKSIRFSTKPNIIPRVAPSFDMDDVWYNRNEIESFKANAKADCQTFRRQQTITPLQRTSKNKKRYSNQKQK